MIVAAPDCAALLPSEKHSARMARARNPPRLAVLSFCAMPAMAQVLAPTIASVISRPCPVDDKQALPSAQQLFRSVASGDSIKTSCDDEEAAMSRRPPSA